MTGWPKILNLIVEQAPVLLRETFVEGQNHTMKTASTSERIGASKSSNQTDQKSVETALNALNLNINSTDVTNTQSQIKQYGWTFAGAFLATIVRLQTSIAGDVDGGLPVVQGPSNPDVGLNTTNVNQSNTNPNSVASIRMKVFSDVGEFSQLLNQSFLPGNGIITATPEQIECAGSYKANSLDTATTGTVSWESAVGGDVVNQVFNWLDDIAKVAGVWNSGAGLNMGFLKNNTAGQTCPGNGTHTFQLGVNFTGGVDAMESLVSWGHMVLTAGLRAAGFGAALLAGAEITSTISSWLGIADIGGIVAKLGAAAKVAGMFMEAFAFVLIAIGFPFAFILPLMPFIRFFFGVVVWLGQVIESVIAIPLVALAQLNPEGAGFAGKATTAYIFAFSIFLRPVLMVFGLIAGWMIFIVAANFLTVGFSAAVVASGGTNCATSGEPSFGEVAGEALSGGQAVGGRPAGADDTEHQGSQQFDAAAREQAALVGAADFLERVEALEHEVDELARGDRRLRGEPVAQHIEIVIGVEAFSEPPDRRRRGVPPRRGNDPASAASADRRAEGRRESRRRARSSRRFLPPARRSSSCPCRERRRSRSSRRRRDGLLRGSARRSAPARKGLRAPARAATRRQAGKRPLRPVRPPFHRRRRRAAAHRRRRLHFSAFCGRYRCGRLKR